MNLKEKQELATLICYHFVEPIKENGVDHDQVAMNALRFIQDYLKGKEDVVEMISHFETVSNINAGAQFLEELNLAQKE